MRPSSKRATRQAERSLKNTAKVLTLGLGLILVPLFLQGTPIGSALKDLPFLGVLITLAGGVMLWFERRDVNVRGVETVTNVNAVRFLNPPPRVLKSDAPERPSGWGAAVLDVIEWRRLEAVVETLFQQAGFETKAQSHGADGGVDIWLYSKYKPGKPASVVQCKHWSNKVGVDKVREFRGVMASHNVERGQFVGTGGFSPDAMAFAKTNGINLLDQNKLLELVSLRNPEQQQRLLEVALEGDYWKPTCASCGVKMVLRAPRSGGREFWGCVKFPACRNTL